jgi:hypothetical protein
MCVCASWDPDGLVEQNTMVQFPLRAASMQTEVPRFATKRV